MVEEGTFRRDLYFRINIVKLTIPPLRERKEDIPLLLEVALNKFNASYGRKVQRVSPDVLKLLLNYDFPGNVRELLNVIEQAVILCKGNEIGVDLIPKEFTANLEKPRVNRRRSSRAPDTSTLYDVLTRHKGNRAGAAEELGVDRSTLWRWVKNAGFADA
jgi:transcriptional regulator with PAS, ATPase and Fis domain